MSFIRRLLTFFAAAMVLMTAVGCEFSDIPLLPRKTPTPQELIDRANEMIDDAFGFHVKGEYEASVTYLFTDLKEKYTEEAWADGTRRRLKQHAVNDDSIYEVYIVNNILYLNYDGDKKLYHDAFYFNGEPEITDYLPVFKPETLTDVNTIKNDDGTLSFTVKPEVDEIEFLFDGFVNSILEIATVKENNSELTFKFDKYGNLKTVDYKISIKFSMSDDSAPGLSLNLPVNVEGEFKFLNIGASPNIPAPLDRDNYTDCGDW